MKKCLIKFLAFSLVLSVVFSSFVVSASEFTSGKHAGTSVVNISGKIDAEKLVDGKPVTVLVVEDLGGSAERVAHIAEIVPDAFGNFDAKFVCKASDNSTLKATYQGESIHNSLIKAEINGRSTLMEANVILLSNRGGSFNLKDWGAMPEKSFVSSNRGINATYQSDYTFDKVTGVKAYVEVNNVYGFEESYTPIIACYDANNKLVGIKVFKEQDVAFDDKNNVLCTDVVTLHEDTVRAKAFAWDKDVLIPFGEASEGELDKIDVILVGASTACDWSGAYYPEGGFGTFFGDYFNTGYVTFHNKSVSGASTTSFLDDAPGKGYWPDVVSLVGPGDYVIIELGGNDRNSTTEDQFKANLMKMYNDVTEKGGIVIFAGVTVDAQNTSTGKFAHDSKRLLMSQYKKDIAELTDSEFITCEDEILAFYNEQVELLGSTEKVIGKYFRDSRYMLESNEYGFADITEENVYLTDGFNKNEDGYAIDKTHTNLRGAEMVAEKFYDALMKSNSKLRFYTK